MGSSFSTPVVAGALRVGLLLIVTGLAQPARASLEAYDGVIAADAVAGLATGARLTNAATFNDRNSRAFNFGTVSGDVTMEFIVEGDPVAGGVNGYLAVGANASSSLRFEQWSDTGQLGFTQSGVADYLFVPAVPSPNVPVHVAFVWQASARTMRLYLNGSLAGTRSGVDAAFAMPTGQGFLGNNSAGTEGMVGTIHRVTVYDDLVPEAALQRHADAYNDVVRPPVIVSFTANPPAIFSPGSATLAWTVANASAVFLNGADVTSQSSLIVSPAATTTYTLLATNPAGASATGQVTVVVNPAPVIDRFVASRQFVAAGEAVTLSWNVRYALDLAITPNVGDVTTLTTNGAGSVQVRPLVAGTFTLTANSAFGSASANVTIDVVTPATHPVISEFLADNEGPLADEDGQFSDWIEVHNPMPAAINLAGYFLTDQRGDPTKWAFPNVSLGAGAYLIVFASGKNRVNPAGRLHTDFQLDKAGEYLALVGPGPVVLHEFAPAFPPQTAGASYGILAGNVGLARYLGVPTPGAANDDTPAPPAPVEFSRASGFVTEPFSLTLTAPTPGSTIRFTTNGAMPSATNGAIYSGPITIPGTRRVRAVAVIAGRASRVAGESYVKLAPDLVNYRSTLPLLVIENFGAGTIPQKGWSGNGSGIKQLPRQSAVWATFARDGGGASAFTNGPQMFSTIGIRGRGAFSSTWRQKPFSVEALDEEGAEKSVAPLGMPAHADWVLYFPDPDNNKDPALLFNTFAYELSEKTGHYAVRFRWVEAFINEDGGDLRLADRRGVYAIMEKVSRGADRLDFQPLSADGRTGGWLLNLNRMDPEPEDGWPAPNGATRPWFFHTAGPNRMLQTPPNAIVVGDDLPQQINGFLNFDNPNGYTINTNQRAAIENWFKPFEDALYNNAVWRDPVNGYRKYIDATDFADYFVLNVLTRNGDGLLISMFPWKGDDGKLRMGPAWDYNWNPYYVSGGPTGQLLWRSDQLWYTRLFTDPDFTQLYIDRWWDMRRGAMSNAGMEAIIDRQVADISPEKAVLNGFPNVTNWLGQIAQFKSWLTNRANWIDGNYHRPPVFNHPGGPVADGFQLVVFATNGTIYFTTDGSDPRAPGGAIAASAQAYQLPVALHAQTLVQARVRVGTNWSGVTRAVFYPPQDLTTLAVTEIMYNPPMFGAMSGDEVEFVELKNTGPNALLLGTLRFSDGINFTFTNGTRLAPGQFFVLARNAAAFQSKYPGVPVNGVFTGRLDNGGETIRLVTPSGATVLAVNYNDRAPWPLAADGHGFSLVPRAGASPNSDDGARWRASAAPGGSPGADDPEPAFPGVVINEALTHTDLPAVDQVELFNPTASAVDIGGWFLSDDGGVPKKFRIPNGTILPAGGYRVFSETDFNPMPGTALNFSLDSAGDAIYLSSGDAMTNLTGYSHPFTFGAAANGVSFGRYVNSVGEEHFPAQRANTLGATNAGPLIGPVVIQEILYHPDAGGDEFVELRNVTASDVPLFDPAHPTNTWRVNGLGFAFPTNVVLPANGILLIAGLDPAVFRAKYTVPAGVPVIGPYAGALQDSGERLELQRPDAPGTNGVPPFITVDEVRYNDKAPWPPAADGSGASLQRKLAAAYGNDPINWEAARPTPGADFVPGQPPVIVMPPLPQTIVAFQDAQFSVVASGAPTLFYQWLFNGDPLAGATNTTLQLRTVRLDQAGRYSVIVFNAEGSVTSASAELTTLFPAVILEPPQSRTVSAGANAAFSVTALGVGPLRYQWRFNNVELPGATNATLTLTNVQTSDAGPYTVVVTDNVGPNLSSPALLTVLVRPTIVSQPQGVIAVAGDTVRFGVRVAGTPPFGYRWRRSGAAVTNYVLNASNSIFTIVNAQPVHAGVYTVVVTNAGNTIGILSANAPLTVLADADRDHIPDEWETAARGLNPNDPSDASRDFDGDGVSNLQEYIAGTDPQDATSYLKVDRFRKDGAGATLQFLAVSNKTYTVEFNDVLDGTGWSKLLDLPFLLTNRLETITDPSPTTGSRYYRLATPATP